MNFGENNMKCHFCENENELELTFYGKNLHICDDCLESVEELGENDIETIWSGE